MDQNFEIMFCNNLTEGTRAMLTSGLATKYIIPTPLDDKDLHIQHYHKNQRRGLELEHLRL